MRLSERRRHTCAPPTGVVFLAVWTCPECGTEWQLIEHATYSEWVLVTRGGET